MNRWVSTSDRCRCAMRSVPITRRQPSRARWSPWDPPVARAVRAPIDWQPAAGSGNDGASARARSGDDVRAVAPGGPPCPVSPQIRIREPSSERFGRGAEAADETEAGEASRRAGDRAPPRRSSPPPWRRRRPPARPAARTWTGTAASAVRRPVTRRPGRSGGSPAELRAGCSAGRLVLRIRARPPTAAPRRGASCRTPPRCR